MAAGEPPDRTGMRHRRGWWIAAGLLALLLAVLVVLAVLGGVQWWWLVGCAGGAVLVVLRAAGRLHRTLRRPRMRELAGATMVAGVARLVALWVKAPDLYTTRDAEKGAVATATTRAGILTLGAAIAAGLVAWVSLAETRRANREADQRDRYAKAIEQLGSSQLDVRLGGIYGLERIVKASDALDQRTVVEVLSAFIREHSRPMTSRMLLPIERSRMQATEHPPARARQDRAATSRPATDVQAAVSVLGRLPARPDVPRADLTNVQLTGAVLDGANLTLAMLGGANLTLAMLGGANLFGAMLGGANLTGAQLHGANLATAKWLTQQQLDSARGDDQTTLPEGLQRPAHWSSGPAANQ